MAIFIYSANLFIWFTNSVWTDDVGYYITLVNIRYDFANFFGSVTFVRRFQNPGNYNKAATSILLQSIDLNFELAILFFEIIYFCYQWGNLFINNFDNVFWQFRFYCVSNFLDVFVRDSELLPDKKIQMFGYNTDYKLY